MEKTKVSVIIPVYNIEKYIKRCLDSVLNQTYSNLEVICVNDGSTDNSLEILKEYGRKDDRIKVFSKENKGVSAARNLGIKEVTGEYITFIDGDDFVELNMIEDMVNIMKENSADIVKCAYVKDYIYKQIPYNLKLGKEISIYENESMPDLYDFFLNKYILNSMCCQLINASIIKDNNILVNTEYAYGEDARFNYELYSFANKVVLVDKTYYHYFYNDNSATTIKKEDSIVRRIKEAILLYDSLYDYIKKWNIETDENKQKIAGRVIKEFVYRSRELFVLAGQGYSKSRIEGLVNDMYSSDVLQRSLKINQNDSIQIDGKEAQLYLKCVLSGNMKKYTSLGVNIFKVKRFIKKVLKKSPRG